MGSAGRRHAAQPAQGRRCDAGLPRANQKLRFDPLPFLPSCLVLIRSGSDPRVKVTSWKNRVYLVHVVLKIFDQVDKTLNIILSQIEIIQIE